MRDQALRKIKRIKPLLYGSGSAHGGVLDLFIDGGLSFPLRAPLWRGEHAVLRFSLELAKSFFVLILLTRTPRNRTAYL